MKQRKGEQRRPEQRHQLSLLLRGGATMTWHLPPPTVETTVCDYCHDVVVTRHTRLTLRGFVICVACLLIRFLRNITREFEAGGGEVPST